jgi:hypothetical protein
MKEVRAIVVLSAKSLATCCVESARKLQTLTLLSAYLSDTPDVLLSVLGREAKILVQAEPDVVAVQSVGLETKVEEVLLESNGNGRLSRGGETGEPDGGTLLLAKIGALLTGETGVPGDVAAANVRICVGLGGRWRGRRGARREGFLRQWRGLTLPLLLL